MVNIGFDQLSSLDQQRIAYTQQIVADAQDLLALYQDTANPQSLLLSGQHFRIHLTPQQVQIFPLNSNQPIATVAPTGGTLHQVGVEYPLEVFQALQQDTSKSLEWGRYSHQSVLQEKAEGLGLAGKSFVDHFRKLYPSGDYANLMPDSPYSLKVKGNGLEIYRQGQEQPFVRVDEDGRIFANAISVTEALRVTSGLEKGAQAIAALASRQPSSKSPTNRSAYATAGR